MMLVAPAISSNSSSIPPSGTVNGATSICTLPPSAGTLHPSVPKSTLISEEPGVAEGVNSPVTAFTLPDMVRGRLLSALRKVIFLSVETSSSNTGSEGMENSITLKILLKPSLMVGTTLEVFAVAIIGMKEMMPSAKLWVAGTLTGISVRSVAPVGKG